MGGHLFWGQTLESLVTVVFFECRSFTLILGEGQSQAIPRILAEIPLSCTSVHLDHLTSPFICNTVILDRRARLEPLLIASLAPLLLCVVP